MKHGNVIISYTTADNAKKGDFSKDIVVGVYRTWTEARIWLEKFAVKYNNEHNMPGIYNWHDGCDVALINDGTMFCIEHFEDFLEEQ